MAKLKRDKYKSSRGGDSRLLAIACATCATPICTYQKDGPGMLRRIYLDRMDNTPVGTGNLMCPGCGKLIGSYTIYEKEQRPAYRLYVGSIAKSIAKT
jgi:ribosomal protein S27E